MSEMVAVNFACSIFVFSVSLFSLTIDFSVEGPLQSPSALDFLGLLTFSRPLAPRPVSHLCSPFFFLQPVSQIHPVGFSSSAQDSVLSSAVLVSCVLLFCFLGCLLTHLQHAAEVFGPAELTLADDSFLLTLIGGVWRLGLFLARAVTSAQELSLSLQASIFSW
jgi:hypothetical protein